MGIFVKFPVKCYEKSLTVLPLHSHSIPVKKTYPIMNSKLSKAICAFVNPTTAFKTVTVISFFALPSTVFAQQSITGIITDFNGYWKTSASSVSPVKPNNSHNLLAFTFNNVQYSTGVNNTLLNSKGETYVDGDFWSLPLANISGAINSNTKVGLGEMYDGVHNGKGTQNYVNDIARYLNDGTKGLDLGTCVANLPAGNVTFMINNIRPSNIGDGIPDIVVTQVADYSGTNDKYSLVDVNGNVIGQTKEIIFNNVPAIANWTADFYEASSNPMTLSAGFTNTDRPMRLWAADLADFGITQANYSSVKNFRITLSGNSDVAFVAYNNKTMTIATVLPVELNDFTVRESNGKGLLNWATTNEKGADYFVVEKSADGLSFTSIDTVKAKGENTTLQRYASVDAQLNAGNNYYRLKMVDQNKHSSYSKTLTLTIKAEIRVNVYPNPASDRITVSHSANATEAIKLYNVSGVLIQQKKVDSNSTQTSLDVSSYAKGIYYLVIENEKEKTTKSFVVR